MRAAAVAARLALLLPTLLIVPAASKYVSGLGLDSVFPVPVYITMNVPQAPESYRAAAHILERTPDVDGRTALAGAEAMFVSGAALHTVDEVARAGIAKAPADIRGWLLLAEIRRSHAPADAARMLEVALLLGPYDYWVAGKRARLAAALWDRLSEEARMLALRQVRLLWAVPTLRHDLMTLLSSEAGAHLVSEAFREMPDDLRALNRWVAAERRKSRS